MYLVHWVGNVYKHHLCNKYIIIYALIRCVRKFVWVTFNIFTFYNRLKTIILLIKKKSYMHHTLMTKILKKSFQTLHCIQESFQIIKTLKFIKILQPFKPLIKLTWILYWMQQTSFCPSIESLSSWYLVSPSNF